MTNTSPQRIRSLVERYVLPPDEIERRSLALVDQALADRFAGDERRVAGRIVYAAGDLGLAEEIRFSSGAVAAGIAALRSGRAVVADVRMVAAGLDRARLDALGCPLVCAIEAPEAASRARVSRLPRSVEAIRLLAASFNGAIAVIGNAPTALLALLDLVDVGAVRPALIIGMPVGFVAAAESKQALVERDIPYVTVVGTRGGSPLAAASLNALARLALPHVGSTA